MMRRSWILLGALALSVTTTAQDTINRQVTVEREFQPVIKNAKKLSVNPVRVEADIPAEKVSYSTYSEPLPAVTGIQPLAGSATRFAPPEISRGWLEGNVGHNNTYLDFIYRLRDKKEVGLDLYAKHDAHWGRNTLETSKVGMDFKKSFTPLDVYFTVEGQNRYYSRYGRYYDGHNGLTIDKMKDLQPQDWQALWDVHTNIGIRSASSQQVQYCVQTGYHTLIVPSVVAEHRVQSYAMVEWQTDHHHAGMKAHVRNAFMTLDKDSMHLDPASYNNRHGIRINPYYEYISERVRVHAGANLDMNIGRGQFLTQTENLSFAPSPDVKVEYRIIPSWLMVWAEAKGSFGYGMLVDYYDFNRYLGVENGIQSHHVCGYTPVDAGLGFRIKPCAGLLLDIHARYAYRMNQKTILAPDTLTLWTQAGTNLAYLYGNWQQWSVGGEITYHYQDIVHILASGYYYKWIQQSLENKDYAYNPAAAYDHPDWDAHLRIDANIDRKWSLYSDNIFEGARTALTTAGDVKLKPTIDLRLGVQYAVNRWLKCYLQLNNYLNRHHDIYYGYQSQGINGQIGVRWEY